MTKLIGIYSPAPQSGKTSVATFLERYGYQRVSFATPVKAMAITMLEHLGYSTMRATQLVYEEKSTLIPEIRTTSRHILQTLGTEFGRECIHPELWTICWTAQACQLLAADTPVIADDVRFLEEAHAIKSLGGEMWHLSRDGYVRTTTHASEGGLDDYLSFDFRILNNGSLHSLQLAVCQRLGVAYIPEDAAA